MNNYLLVFAFILLIVVAACSTGIRYVKDMLSFKGFVGAVMSFINFFIFTPMYTLLFVLTLLSALGIYWGFTTTCN